MNRFRHIQEFNELVAHVTEFEGGYANHPSDPGGETNRGVTYRTFQELAPKIGVEPTYERFRNLSDDDFRAFLRYYWVASGAPLMESGAVAAMLAELRWGGGSGRVAWVANKAAEALGKPYNFKGDVGEAEAEILNSFNPSKLFDAMHEARMLYYQRIVANKPSSNVFMRGWTRRANSFYERFKKKRSRGWLILVIALVLILGIVAFYWFYLKHKLK